MTYLFPDGSERTVLPDGTVHQAHLDGEHVIEFPNGQREIHTDQFKVTGSMLRVIYSPTSLFIPDHLLLIS